MPISELIAATHLARKALIYIRQSSPHQVLTNQESLQMQYALRERAARLGWRAEDIEVIDTDLGLSGRAAEHRAGFKERSPASPSDRSGSFSRRKSTGCPATARTGIRSSTSAATEVA